MKDYTVFPDIKEFHDIVNRLAAESACREYFGINARDSFPLNVTDEDRDGILTLLRNKQ